MHELKTVDGLPNARRDYPVVLPKSSSIEELSGINPAACLVTFEETEVFSITVRHVLYRAESLDVI